MNHSKSNFFAVNWVVYSEEIGQVSSSEILFKNNNYQWIDFFIA